MYEAVGFFFFLLCTLPSLAFLHNISITRPFYIISITSSCLSFDEALQHLCLQLLSSIFIFSFFSSFILHSSSSLDLSAFVFITPILFSSIKLYGIFAFTAFLHTYFLHLCVFGASYSPPTYVLLLLCNIFINILFLFFKFHFLVFLLMSMINPFFFSFLQAFKDILVGCFLPLFFFNNLFFFSFADVLFIFLFYVFAQVNS